MFCFFVGFFVILGLIRQTTSQKCRFANSHAKGLGTCLLSTGEDGKTYVRHDDNVFILLDDYFKYDEWISNYIHTSMFNPFIVDCWSRLM